jgi:hypothetical protein
MIIMVSGHSRKNYKGALHDIMEVSGLKQIKKRDGDCAKIKDSRC